MSTEPKFNEYAFKQQLKDDEEANKQFEWNRKISETEVIKRLFQMILKQEEDLNTFKADLSKALFQITERLTQAESKISLLDKERLFLEGRIQTLEADFKEIVEHQIQHTSQIRVLQEDITTLEEDTEITHEADYEAAIDYRAARDER